jgi:4-hydroxybenzoyl-CoA reductase subunit beta
MTLPEFSYSEPRSLRKACELLQEENTVALGGGTDMMMSLKNRLKVPRRVVDLEMIPRLNSIRHSEHDGLTLGAMVSLHHLAENELVRARYPVLARAARMVGTRQIQTMGTVGGNLCQDNLCVYYNRSPMGRQGLAPCHKLGGSVCHAVPHSDECWATYAGDFAPVLLVLGATLTIASVEGRRRIPLTDFYSGDGETPNLLRPGEILAEIEVPVTDCSSRLVYVKIRQRNALDYPMLGVAVHLRMDGEVWQAALALTAVDRKPVLVEGPSELAGGRLDDLAVEAWAEAAWRQAHPLNNTTESSAAYRKQMVKVHVRQALRMALKGAEGVSV